MWRAPPERSGENSGRPPRCSRDADRCVNLGQRGFFSCRSEKRVACLEYQGLRELARLREQAGAQTAPDKWETVFFL